VVYFTRNIRFDELKMQSTISLSVVQVKPSNLLACIGMVNAPTKGKPRNLFIFTAASLASKKKSK